MNLQVKQSGIILFPTAPPSTIGPDGSVSPSFWNWFVYSPVDSSVYTLTALYDTISSPPNNLQYRLHKLDRATNSVVWTVTITVNQYPGTGELYLVDGLAVSGNGLYVYVAKHGVATGGGLEKAFVEKRSTVNGSLTASSALLGLVNNGATAPSPGDSLTVATIGGVEYVAGVLNDENSGTGMQCTAFVFRTSDMATIINRQFAVVGSGGAHFYSAFDASGNLWVSATPDNVLQKVTVPANTLTTKTLSGITNIYGLLYDSTSNALLVFDGPNYTTGNIFKYSLATDPPSSVGSIAFSGSGGLFLLPGSRIELGATWLAPRSGTIVKETFDDTVSALTVIKDLTNSPPADPFTSGEFMALDDTSTNSHITGDVVFTVWDMVDTNHIFPYTNVNAWEWFDLMLVPPSGNIVIQKITNPPGDTQAFTFTPSYGTPFILTDGQTNDSGPITPGTYSVSETPVTGWTTAVDQDPSNIVLGNGDTITITFTNTKIGPLPGPCAKFNLQKLILTAREAVVPVRGRNK